MRWLGSSATTADSAIGSAAYNITGSASTPDFNQPGGTLQGNQTVQLTAAQGGVICYQHHWLTRNGWLDRLHDRNSLHDAHCRQFERDDLCCGWRDRIHRQPVGSAAYVINPYWDGSSPSGQPPRTAPTFSPVPGTYTGTQTVTISPRYRPHNAIYLLHPVCSTPTFTPEPDNQTGACAQGTLYTGPISVSSTQTLYAMAGTNAASLPSSLVNGTYTISSSGGSLRPAPPTLLGAQVH